MKTNFYNLLKTGIAVCLLIMVSINANAQEGKKLIKKKKVAPMEGRVKPTITSPSAGSVIDGPFVLVGKAEPNTTVNVAVSPIYKLPKSGTGTILRVSTPLHEPQEFTAKADANGVWQSRLVEVQYDPKATDRKIFASVYQIWGSEVLRSGNTEYLGSPKLTMLKETIKVPMKPKEEEKTSGQPQTDGGIRKGEDDKNAMPFQISSPKNNRYVAHDSFGIAGIAPVGATVKVEVRYSINGASETALCEKAAANGYAAAIVKYQKPAAGADWNSRAKLMGEDFNKAIVGISGKYGIDKDKSVVGGFSYTSFMLFSDISANTTLSYTKGVLGACGGSGTWNAQNFKVPIFAINCSGNYEGNFNGKALYDQIPANSPIKAKSEGVTDNNCNSHCGGDWTDKMYTKMVAWLQ